MSERLEEIQKEVNYAYRRDGSISTKAVTMPIEHYEHLYEQAERVQELEKARKTLSDNHFQQIEQHKYLLQQNKRYREAIEKVLYETGDKVIQNILETALESDEG